MTHHLRETVDETIDRVAAGLTMVPADPAAARRIAAQVNEDVRFAWPRFVVATAVVGAVVVLAVVLRKNEREAPPIFVARSDVSAPASELPRPTVAPQSITTDVRRMTRKRAAVVEETLPEIPQIDALPSPPPIGVDDLSTSTLTIEPVSVAPLDLANLVVADVGARDNREE